MVMYNYAGRTFATIGAAKTFHEVGDWFNSKYVHKQPSSFTRTLTKKKQDTKMEDSVQGLKQYVLRMSTGLPALKGMLNGHVDYRDQDTVTINTSGNRQTAQMVSFLGTSEQWLSGSTNVVINRSNVSYTPWVNLNPSGGIAGSSVVTLPVSLASDKMGLSYGTFYHDIVNRSTAPCFVKILYFTAKQDTDEWPLEAYVEGTTSNAIYNSSYVIGGAGTVPTGSGNETVSYSAPTSVQQGFLLSVPYTNILSRRTVKTSWRLIKSKSLTVSAADVVRVTSLVKMNQFCIKDRMANASVVFPKGCVACVFVSQGSACVDTASQKTIIGAPNLGIVTTRKIKLCPMKVPSSRFETNYIGAGTVPTGSTNANTEQISETLVNISNFDT